MNYVQIINIVAYVGCVALFGVALFFKVRGNAVGAVSELIAMAESTGLAGKEKMEMVVAALYERIPAIFKSILNEDALQKIAQWIFDWMKKYAFAYIESHKENPEEPDMEIIKETNDELVADVVTRLVGMGNDGVRAYAEECGIDISDLSDSEVVRAVILFLLKK